MYKKQLCERGDRNGQDVLNRHRLFLFRHDCESANEGNAVVVRRLEKGIPAEENDEFMLVRAVEPRIFASGRVIKAD